MEVSSEILWLLAGIILITLEFTAIPGVGMLFAGISALLVGVLVESAGLSSTYQWVIFLALTIILTLLLYKPLRKYQTSKDAKYSNLIGESASVIGTLEPGMEGRVKWSGTTMRARLQSANILTEGKPVRVTGVDGNVLIVTEE